MRATLRFDGFGNFRGPLVVRVGIVLFLLVVVGVNDVATGLALEVALSELM